MNEEEIKAMEKEVSVLISQLEIEAEVKISVEDQGGEKIISLQMESPQAASLIGFHGEVLQSLQLIISFMCHKKLGQWVKVLVNVGDYRQKREEQLQRLALSLAMKAKFSGEVQTIPNLSASERRFIHLVLSENPDVYSESEGEGKQRQLTIKPKK